MTDPTEMLKPLGVETTPIPGFLRIDLTVHGDNRGWFKENWQREKMVALGLPDFWHDRISAIFLMFCALAVRRACSWTFSRPR